LLLALLLILSKVVNILRGPRPADCFVRAMKIFLKIIRRAGVSLLLELKLMKWIQSNETELFLRLYEHRFIFRKIPSENMSPEFDVRQSHSSMAMKHILKAPNVSLNIYYGSSLFIPWLARLLKLIQKRWKEQMHSLYK
jgi:hypothetical protein